MKDFFNIIFWRHKLNFILRDMVTGYPDTTLITIHALTFLQTCIYDLLVENHIHTNKRKEHTLFIQS